jgi:hypothetical protein
VATAFLCVYDLANICTSGALLIHKDSKYVDHNLFHLLPVNEALEIPFIDWLYEVAISPRPDWDHFKADLLAKV